MIGLKRGMVELFPHDPLWDKEAKRTIDQLYELLGKKAIAIKHVGSTAISSIGAKPIIDIVIGVNDIESILADIDMLGSHNIIYRGEDVKGQLLFVMGDMNKDTRSHHIHVVKWQSEAWNNYLNFRDYLNNNYDKAKEYEKLKEELAKKYPDNRQKYTIGKQQFIDEILKKAIVGRLNERNEDKNETEIS